MNSAARTRRAGRALAPSLAHAFLRRPFGGALELLESYLAFVQGKGSGGGWDLHAEARIVVPHIRRQDAVIFDVGAHHGEWSRSVLSLLGPGSRSRQFLFEPLEYNLTVLRAQDLPRSTIVAAAVDDRSGKATLFAFDTQSPAARHDPLDAWSHVPSLYRRREAQLQKYDFVEEEVDVVTIDEIIDRFGIDVVDFMKLDVEGNELAVLQGSRNALQSKRIRALTFEFGCGNINSRTYFHDFWDLLTGYGYAIQRICPGGVLLEIEEYYENLEYFRGVSNYLATAR